MESWSWLHRHTHTHRHNGLLSMWSGSLMYYYPKMLPCSFSVLVVPLLDLLLLLLLLDVGTRNLPRLGPSNVPFLGKPRQWFESRSSCPWMMGDTRRHSKRIVKTIPNTTLSSHPPRKRQNREWHNHHHHHYQTNLLWVLAMSVAVGVIAVALDVDIVGLRHSRMSILREYLP